MKTNRKNKKKTKTKVKISDQKALARILSNKNVETEINWDKGCSYIELTLDKEHRTEKGFYKDRIGFVFDDDGGLESITLGIEDYKMMESEDSGNVLNRQKL